MKKYIYLIIISVIILTSLLINFSKIGYFIFTSRIKSISSYDIEIIGDDRLESDLLILVGRSSCASCINTYKDIKAIFEKVQIKDIRYYDTDKNRQNSNFEKVGDYLNVEFIPSLVYIKNGNVEYTFSPIDLDINNIDAIIDKLQ